MNIDIELVITFCILNLVNVMLITTTNLCTVKYGKVAAAGASAVAYGFYTIVIVYMVGELPLPLKVFIVASANFLGVLIVKIIEEKVRKDKLWKIETIIPKDLLECFLYSCKDKDLVFNYVELNDSYLFNFYCHTQEESLIVKDLLSKKQYKYFASETKAL